MTALVDRRMLTLKKKPCGFVSLFFVIFLFVFLFFFNDSQVPHFFLYPVLCNLYTAWHRYCFCFSLEFWSSITTLSVQNILKRILKMVFDHKQVGLFLFFSFFLLPAKRKMNIVTVSLTKILKNDR